MWIRLTHSHRVKDEVNLPSLGEDPVNYPHLLKGQVNPATEDNPVGPHWMTLGEPGLQEKPHRKTRSNDRAKPTASTCRPRVSGRTPPRRVVEGTAGCSRNSSLFGPVSSSVVAREPGDREPSGRQDREVSDGGGGREVTFTPGLGSWQGRYVLS